MHATFHVDHGESSISKRRTGTGAGCLTLILTVTTELWRGHALRVPPPPPQLLVAAAAAAPARAGQRCMLASQQSLHIAQKTQAASWLQPSVACRMAAMRQLLARVSFVHASAGWGASTTACWSVPWTSARANQNCCCASGLLLPPGRVLAAMCARRLACQQPRCRPALELLPALAAHASSGAVRRQREGQHCLRVPVIVVCPGVWQQKHFLHRSTCDHLQRSAQLSTIDRTGRVRGQTEQAPARTW